MTRLGALLGLPDDITDASLVDGKLYLITHDRVEVPGLLWSRDGIF